MIAIAYCEARVSADRITCIIANYERGALTKADVCLEVLIAAGEGDAKAIFAQLPPALRDMVTRDIARKTADDTRIVESDCGVSGDAHARESREQVMRRGMLALQRIAGVT
jgi:hypothetical protein